MSIWRPSARQVLELFSASTAHKFYLTEIQQETQLSRTTLCPLLEGLAAVGALKQEIERPGMDTFGRALRKYYTLTPMGLQLLHL